MEPTITILKEAYDFLDLENELGKVSFVDKFYHIFMRLLGND